MSRNNWGSSKNWQSEGGGGVSDYADLENKPSVNGVELDGDLSLNDLGVQSALVSGTNIKTINGETILGAGNLEVLSHNRGTYTDIADAPSTGEDGDFIAIIDTSASPVTGEIYVWDATENDNAGGWTATGFTANLGTINYSDLLGKPTINGIVITGDYDAEHYALLLDVVKPFIYTKTVYTREDLLDMPLLNYTAATGGKVYGTSSTSKHGMLPVKAGDIVVIKASANNVTSYCFIDQLDHASSGGVLDAVGDAVVVAVAAGTQEVITIPDGCNYLFQSRGTSSNSYQYCPNSITIYRKVEEKEIETSFDYTESANLLDPNKVKLKYALSTVDGLLVSTSSSNKGVTDYIPVTSEGLYAYNGTVVGSNALGCVYDASKNFLRTFSTLLYTYQEGDAYVRYVVDMSSTDGNKTIVRGTVDLGNFGGSSYKQPLEQTFIEGVLIAEEGVPSARPARGAIGVGILSASADTLTDSSLNTGSDDLNTIRPMANIAVAAKITTFNEIEVGQGYNSDQGWAVKFNGTNVILGRYSSNTFIAQQTKPHGLTIDSYIKIEIVRNGMKAKVRLMTKGGEFVDELDSEDTSYASSEKYGRAFVYADSTTALTDVKLSHTPTGLKKPVWFVGASYMALYEKRMTTQLIKTFGVDNFTIIGIPGYNSGQVFEMLSNALKYGCPRYVVWGPGMNDGTIIAHRVWLIEAIKLSKKYGFDLIPCKIPYPEDQSTHAITSKAGINNDIDLYCSRWIDLFAAVSADAEGHWYDGYHDTDDSSDNKHPSVLGAKAMAAQVLTDFPEIANY